MKKTICLLLAALITALFALPAAALTDTAVFTMDIDRQEWNVVIFNYNEEEFARLYGTTYDSVHNYLASTNTYINAVGKTGSREITVKKTAVNTNNDGWFENLTALSAKQKKKVAERSVSAFARTGGDAELQGIYEHHQTDFLVFDMTFQSGEPDEYYGIRYYTVVNGINIYIDYYNYAEAITADERDEVKAMIDSICFNDVEERPGASALWIIIPCSVGAAAAVAAVFAVLIRKKKKRAQKSRETE